MNEQEVQPVDSYVRELLKVARDEGGVRVDVDRPTRTQRLDTALYFDSRRGCGWQAIEVMVGRRIGSEEQPESNLVGATMLMRAFEGDNPLRLRRFYDGIRHDYSPKE